MDPSIGVAPNPGLRERGKRNRRRRILDAAERLIRESGSTDFTIAELADQAVVSIPTIYNLLGSKAGILYALLNRSLDPLTSNQGQLETAADPVESLMVAARRGTDIFVDDPDFYRPLYRYLLGVGDAVHRPLFLERSRQYWVEALKPLQAAGQLLSRKIGEQLARTLVLGFMGALDLWVQSELDHRQFRAQVLHDAGLILLGFATDDQRSGLLRQLRQQQNCLPSRFEAAAASE